MEIENKLKKSELQKYTVKWAFTSKCSHTVNLKWTLKNFDSDSTAAPATDLSVDVKFYPGTSPTVKLNYLMIMMNADSEIIEMFGSSEYMSGIEGNIIDTSKVWNGSNISSSDNNGNMLILFCKIVFKSYDTTKKMVYSTTTIIRKPEMFRNNFCNKINDFGVRGIINKKINVNWSLQKQMENYEYRTMDIYKGDNRSIPIAAKLHTHIRHSFDYVSREKIKHILFIEPATINAKATQEITVDNLLNIITTKMDLNVCTADEYYYKPLLKYTQHVDIIFDVNGVIFRGNKALLGSRSQIFQTIFNNAIDFGKKDGISIVPIIKITDFDALIFANMLQFIYCGIAEDIEEYPLQILLISHKYGIEKLKRKCELLLLRKISANVIGHLLTFADHTQSNYLMAGITSYLKNNC